MPLYGFSGVYFAEYSNNNGVVTYGVPFTPGCPIRAELQFQFAEGDLWACDALSVTRRKIVAGNVTFEAKVLSQAAQQKLFGATLKTRSVTVGAQTKTITSVAYSDGDNAPYVGFAGWGPDAVDDSSDKYTAFFVPKAKFTQPAVNLQTINGSITFQTPTTTGRFMHDDTTGKVVAEMAICDSEEEAQAWAQAVFPQAQTTP